MGDVLEDGGIYFGWDMGAGKDSDVRVAMQHNADGSFTIVDIAEHINEPADLEFEKVGGVWCLPEVSRG